MATDREPWGIGLSLSGGGHRATMAGLGAMLALVDGGLNRDVRWAASVSGGSLANAFVSTRCAFRDVGSLEFDAIVRDAVERVGQGLLIGTSAAKVRAAAVAAAVAGCGLAALQQAVRAKRARHVDRLSAASKALAFLLPLVPLVRSRGLLVERSIGEVWCSDREGRLIELVGSRLPSELGYTTEEWDAGLTARDTPTEHVYAATDLHRGGPIYITRDLIVSERRAAPMDRMRLSLAVRASASFPGALPPVRLQLDRYTQDQPWADGAGSVLAIDGGVFNNLASDWFDPQERGDSDWVLTPPSLRVPVRRHVVVDAGAELRPSNRVLLELPVIGFVYGLWRTAMVNYEGGLTGRRDALRTAQWNAVEPSRSLLVPIPGYVTFSRQWVPDPIRMSKEFWRAVRQSASGVPTTLGPLSPAEALSLVAIGYLQTIAALVEASEDKSRFGGAWERWLLSDVLGAVPGAKAAFAKDS